MSIKTKFCVRCGKEKKKLIDGLCADCYFQKHGISVPKKVSIQVCAHCNAIKWHGLWTKTEFPPEYYLAHSLINKIKIPAEAELEDVEIKKTGKNGIVEITISLLGKKFKQEKQVFLEIQKGVCKNCARHLARTPKVIIQIRAKQNISKLIENALSFSKKYSSNIIKVEQQKTGIDIFLSNKEAGKHLAYELRNEFSCKISESAKQYGWNKSKNRPLMKVTYLLKCL